MLIKLPEKAIFLATSAYQPSSQLTSEVCPSLKNKIGKVNIQNVIIRILHRFPERNLLGRYTGNSISSYKLLRLNNERCHIKN